MSAALDVTRVVYERQGASYDTAEEALAETMFGFSRGGRDFIEVCVNGQQDIHVTVELPLRTGWGPFGRSFRDERTVHSLSDVKTLVEHYFRLSHEDMRASLRR